MEAKKEKNIIDASISSFGQTLGLTYFSNDFFYDEEKYVLAFKIQYFIPNFQAYFGEISSFLKPWHKNNYYQEYSTLKGNLLHK